MIHHRTDKPRSIIDEYFKRRRFRARLRACLLAPYWDELASWMAGHGYARGSIYETMRYALRFAEFAENAGLRDPALLTDELANRHQTASTDQPRLQRAMRLCLNRLMAFLREHGIAPVSQPPTVEVRPPVLVEYLHYLAAHRGIGDRRIREHQRHCQAFLELLSIRGKPIGQLDVSEVFGFVSARAESLGQGGRKAMCAALRSFLRFLHLRGHVARDLSIAVPVIPTFKLDRLPEVIAPEDIERILAAVDRSTTVGCRDYAILLILATYGVRSGQLCALRLEDIDWRHETLRIRGVKGGEDTLLPLQPAVGEAVIDYLRHGRPAVASWREVFLRVRPPIRALGGNLRNVIKPYARKAGLTDAPLGAHAWRHACASRLLASGQSLKTIRDTLGHRSIETTFIYTKVDIEKLREAALDWPGTMP